MLLFFNILKSNYFIFKKNIDLDLLTTAISDLGARHAQYKMNGRNDFALGGHCFIFTVKVVVGDKFTPDIEEAFTRMCIPKLIYIIYLLYILYIYIIQLYYIVILYSYIIYFKFIIFSDSRFTCF